MVWDPTEPASIIILNKRRGKKGNCRVKKKEIKTKVEIDDKEKKEELIEPFSE